LEAAGGVDGVASRFLFSERRNTMEGDEKNADEINNP